MKLWNSETKIRPKYDDGPSKATGLSSRWGKKILDVSNRKLQLALRVKMTAGTDVRVWQLRAPVVIYLRVLFSYHSARRSSSVTSMSYYYVTFSYRSWEKHFLTLIGQDFVTFIVLSSFLIWKWLSKNTHGRFLILSLQINAEKVINMPFRD